MSDREIVLVSDEEAKSAEDQKASLYTEFIGQWTAETMPACDEGMRLLLSLAEAQPVAYEMARKQGFSNLTHPMFKELPKWKAFAHHYNICQKCNEV